VVKSRIVMGKLDVVVIAMDSISTQMVKKIKSVESYGHIGHIGHIGQAAG
jgi:hypothetical protein